MKVYLAGACRFNPNARQWREEMKNSEIEGIEWVDPLDHYDGDADPEIEPMDLIQHDIRLVDSCHGIVTRRFPGIESWGTVIETWEAARRSKYVLLISPLGDIPEWAEGIAHSIVETESEALNLLETEITQSYGNTNI